MPQVTLYLDEETEAKLRAAAREAGLSLSRWVADLIREKTINEWPASVVQLAGSWSDMSSAEELRSGLPADGPREPL
ncbi:MAG: CopG family transcriptional regulator [Acidobacteriota bacterium]